MCGDVAGGVLCLLLQHIANVVPAKSMQGSFVSPPQLPLTGKDVSSNGGAPGGTDSGRKQGALVM